MTPDTAYILARVDAAIAGGKLRPFSPQMPDGERPATMAELLDWERRRRRRFRRAGKSQARINELRDEYHCLYRIAWDDDEDDEDDEESRLDDRKLAILEEPTPGPLGKLMNGSWPGWQSLRTPAPCRCEVAAGLAIPGRGKRPPGPIVPAREDTRVFGPMMLGIHQHMREIGLDPPINHPLTAAPAVWPIFEWFIGEYEACGFSVETFFAEQLEIEAESGRNAPDWSEGLLPVYRENWFSDQMPLLEMLEMCRQAMARPGLVKRIVLPDCASEMTVDVAAGAVLMKQKVRRSGLMIRDAEDSLRFIVGGRRWELLPPAWAEAMAALEKFRGRQMLALEGDEVFGGLTTGDAVRGTLEEARQLGRLREATDDLVWRYMDQDDTFWTEIIEELTDVRRDHAERPARQADGPKAAGRGRKGKGKAEGQRRKAEGERRKAEGGPTVPSGRRKGKPARRQGRRESPQTAAA
jgi:hypothetical protein